MIQFTITLSAHQIACLRAIYANEGNHTFLMTAAFKHWYSGTRLLFSERLIESITRPATEEEKKNSENIIYTDGTVNEWKTTEKGRLLLRLVELDVQDYANSINLMKDKILKKIAEGKPDEPPS